MNSKQIKTDFDQIFAAPTVSAFSQRIRRVRERYPDEPILLNRLEILKDKRVLFTNHLKFETESLHRWSLEQHGATSKFLDTKFRSIRQPKPEL